MIREFTLKGLDCPNCAALIESNVRKIEGVSDASINLLTELLKVDTDIHREDLRARIEEITRRFEPDVLVQEKNQPSPMTNASRGINDPIKTRETGKGIHADRMAGADAKGSAGRKRNAVATGSAGNSRVIREVATLVAGALPLIIGVITEHFLNINRFVAFALFFSGYILLGRGVIIKAVKNIINGNVFDENFLMTIATAGAFALGEYAEAAGVMLFYRIGEFFQDLAVEKSKKSIADLMDIRPDYVNLLMNGEAVAVHPETAKVGDLFLVKPGERIPLDGEVVSGEASIDTSTLTGESAPRMASASDIVLSGSVNQNGVLTVKAIREFEQSTASKIIDLVENAAGKKARTESFITRFASYYTPAVVGLAALVAVAPPLFFGGAWHVWLNRSLIFLVISCPCALVLSIPLGYFGGIGAASKRGILIKGGNYIEALANLDIAVFDKTGTLTKGEFEVVAILPAPGVDTDVLLESAALAEAFSNHPIAMSISRKYGKDINTDKLSDYKEIAGRGVTVNAAGTLLAVGNGSLMSELELKYTEPRTPGAKVHVAADGQYLGCVVVADEIKRDSASAIRELKASGVRKVVMLTGDNNETAAAVADALGIEEYHAGLLPQDKVRMLETLSAEKKPGAKLVFAGDGINDAPVLAMADVGVAMGALGSDAAIEAADVVLMSDEPSRLIEAVKIARYTRRVVWQNIIFALATKTLILALGVAGFATMWEAVFADVGVALLAVLNSIRILRAPFNR